MLLAAAKPISVFGRRVAISAAGAVQLASSAVKTSLGIWAFGTMATRFVPGGYQPQWAGEPVQAKVARAVEGLGDLIDGYEFHYPNELSPENLDLVRGALGDHDIYCIASGMHLDPLFGKGGLCSPDDKVRDEAVRRTIDGGRLRGRARRALHHLARDRGLQLSVPVAVQGIVGALPRRDGTGGPARQGPGRDDLPRAQELGAGDEDPDAECRHDASTSSTRFVARASTTSRSTWTGST